MYNTAHFSRMPRANIPATRMRKPQIVAGTSLHGKIVPLFCNLTIPGEIDSNFMNGVIWMSNPIRPLLSQVKGKINVFFVPMRLVWEHTKEFFGENTTSAGPQEIQYKIPMASMSSIQVGDENIVPGTVSHYLGKPITSDGSLSYSVKMSVLKERAFWLVYSEYYRHQQVQNPVLLNKSDSGEIGTLNSESITFGSECPNCLKDFDYFTTGTVSPNYGGEVLLPLGSSAPIYWKPDSGTIPSGDVVADLFTKNTGSSASDKLTQFGGTYDGDSITGKLYADLSVATAAKIDDLYTAMAAQAFYHNLNFGSRFFERLEISYGVTNPDLVLDRPEHVSEFTFDIVVQDVISSAGATADSSTKLGQPGAVSKTVLRKKLYNHSFGEPGFVIALFNTYHERYYSAGIEREDMLEEMLEFYTPEFANRGDDLIYKDEIFAGAGKGAFAYQEPYSWHRYYKNRVTGELDPQSDAPLGPWVLAEKYTEAPTLSASFLEENRDAIKNALVSGENGPDYIWSFNFLHTEVLPMPAYSKPGIPRFGNV